MSLSCSTMLWFIFCCLAVSKDYLPEAAGGGEDGVTVYNTLGETESKDDGLNLTATYFLQNYQQYTEFFKIAFAFSQNTDGESLFAYRFF